MRPPEFWARTDSPARVASAALAPFAWLYGASVAFKRDRIAPWRSNAKVVCVGNIVSGGSGKTPVAISIARALIARGARVSFLTRGYGGTTQGPVQVDANVHCAADVGDEPLLLARVAPTIVARDRKAGAMLADWNGADVIVMDDGHQNFRLAKDLSIVVVDAEAGFGNGRVLPAGPLREPAPQGLARADAVIMLGDGTPDLPGYRGPVLRARLTPTRTTIGGKRLIAFAGIGRPEKFFSTLKSIDADIVGRHAFGDHHPYSRAEISRLKSEATKAGALLVTTEKDHARIDTNDRADILVLSVETTFDAPEQLARLLDMLVPSPQARTEA